MTAPELLRDVEARGVAVRVVGDALKLKPAAALDARVLAEVRAEKLAIIALLRAREYSQPTSGVFFEPCEDGGRFRCFYAGARLAACEASEAARPDDDLEARFADILCAARLGELSPSFCEVVLSASDEAQRIIEAQAKKPMNAPVRDEKELRVLADLLRTLETVQRDFQRRTRAP